MFSIEEIQQARRLAEHPDTPLVGSLVATNVDTYCDWCRGQGKSEDACALDATPEGTWVVDGRYGVYHVTCAGSLGWVPSDKEGSALIKYPRGPYA